MCRRIYRGGAAFQASNTKDKHAHTRGLVTWENANPGSSGVNSVFVFEPGESYGEIYRGRGCSWTIESRFEWILLDLAWLVMVVVVVRHGGKDVIRI